MAANQIDSQEGAELIDWVLGRQKHQVFPTPQIVQTLADNSVIIMVPLAVVGIILNVLTLWIWSAVSIFNPTVYLFKVLAISDLLFITFWFPFFKTKHTGHVKLNAFFSTMSFGNRRFGMYITLLVAVVRIIMVFFPLRSSQLLARFRMKITVASLLALCLAMQTMDDTKPLKVTVGSVAYDTFAVVSRKGFGYLAPATLQIALMVVLMWKVWHIDKVSPSLQNTRSSFSSPSALSDSCDKRRNSRGFVYVVLAMCITSFFTYLLVHTIAVIFNHTASLKPYTGITGFVSTVASVVNSSVNFFFYLFISKFRAAFQLRYFQHRQFFVGSTTSSGYQQSGRSGLPMKERGKSETGEPASSLSPAVIENKTQ